MKLPGWVVLAAVLAMAVLIYLAGSHAGKLSERNANAATLARTLDSIGVKGARDRAVTEELRRSAAEREARADSTLDRAAETRRSAERLRAEADSLAAVAQAKSDSSAAGDSWRLAYEARTEEADSLRSALAKQEKAAALLRGSLADLKAQLVAKDAQLAALNLHLAAAVDRANRAGRCTIAFGISCPSRTETLLVGVVAGGFAAVELARN